MKQKLALRAGALALVGLAMAASAHAQDPPVTSHEFLVYAPGATAPQITTPIALVNVVCSLTAGTPPVGPAVNPTLVQWNDPANVARVCQVNLGAAGPLVALPSGTYEGAVRSLSAGGPGVDSNRDPFVRARGPAALTGFRLLRAAP